MVRTITMKIITTTQHMGIALFFVTIIRAVNFTITFLTDWYTLPIRTSKNNNVIIIVVSKKSLRVHLKSQYLFTIITIIKVH